MSKIKFSTYSRWRAAARRLLTQEGKGVAVTNNWPVNSPLSYVRALAAGCLLQVLVSAPALAQSPEPVRYRLSFPEAQNHYVQVEARVPSAGLSTVEVFLPVWTPGSYMIREYSRHLEGVEALSSDGKSLPLEKTRKNRWQVEPKGSPEVIFRYKVYCREMTVRTCWVEQDFAMLNGAPLFIAPVSDWQRPYSVQVDLPVHWSQVFTGLAPAGQAHTYSARDFDELLDCPILVGNPASYEFRVAGVPHVLVNQGEDGVWDGKRSARDVEKVVTTVYSMWGDMPYAQKEPRGYWFINMLTQARGGLEHSNSTILMGSRWAQRDRQQYLDWLSLVAHEYFHVWNVKRLRPLALGPFDYENEVYTPSLWVAEGITAYYDNLLVRRAGFSSHKEYLEAFSKELAGLQQTPGRKVQSLRLSSFDAWIKLYRPDENSANSAMSYYTKGSVVAFLLDARIRQMTSGKKSLDDVMRAAYKKYSGARGYTEEQFRAVVAEVSGGSLGSFFADYVDGLKELDYGPALKYYGLRFKSAPKPSADATEAGWLGAGVAAKEGRLVVTSVKRETPAHRAGLNVDDELVALDDFRLAGDRSDRLDERLKLYPPGTSLQLLVARREKLLKLPLTLERKPSETWTLEVDPEASADARSRREAWLGPDLKKS